MHHSSKTFGLLLSLLLAVCLFGHIAQAKYGGSGMAASAETSTYVFVPDQSKVVQTGGIAGVHWTYSVKGEFQLTVDPNVGTASFAHVDANATDDSTFKRTLDLNHVFNMTSLVGTVEPSGSIRFTGKASDGSDVLITVTLQDGLAHLIGQTTPPPNSADFFIFSLDAVAQFRKYGGGSGTADDPYQIATAADLISLGETPADYDKDFILTDDIDLDPNLPGCKVFDKAVIAPTTIVCSPKGGCIRMATTFTGVFDGDGHTISHLTITGDSILGLFGRVAYDAEVKHLGVVDVSIAGSGYAVGGLVGRNEGTVTHCYSTGAVSSISAWPGGVGCLVGSNDGAVTTCYSTGNVSGEYLVGGLVGENGDMRSGDITNCYSTATVSGGEHVGGLVGENDRSSLANCYSTGAVSGTQDVGGLAGYNDGSATYCYSTSAVRGESDVGGLVGGNGGALTCCYSTGRVSDNPEVGGLVGISWGGTVAACFWDIQTSGQAISDGGTGKTTAEMQMGKTFMEAGWDFVNVWGIGENQTYPYLRKYSAADINQDASVNFLDLAVLAENWLTDFAP